MRGDWMDEARRFEDTDKAIMDLLRRENATPATMPDCCLNAVECGDAACVFGCGVHIEDDGMCLSCRDHSANRIECETCGQAWEDWSGTWERAR